MANHGYISTRKKQNNIPGRTGKESNANRIQIPLLLQHICLIVSFSNCPSVGEKQFQRERCAENDDYPLKCPNYGFHSNTNLIMSRRAAATEDVGDERPSLALVLTIPLRRTASASDNRSKLLLTLRDFRRRSSWRVNNYNSSGHYMEIVNVWLEEN